MSRGFKLGLVTNSQENLINEILDDHDSDGAADNSIITMDAGDKDLFEEEDDEDPDFLYPSDDEVNNVTKKTLEQKKTQMGKTITPEIIIEEEIAEEFSCIDSNNSQTSVSNLISSGSSGCKPKSAIWNDFNTSEDTNGKKISRCKYCSQIVSSQAQRLSAHIKKCLAKTKLEESPSAQKSFSNAQKPASINFEEQQSGHKKFKQVSLDNYARSVNATQKEQIDTKLGEWIFSTNMPFTTVANERFKKFCQSLNPSYSLPHRETLKTKILDKVFEECIKRRKKNLGQSVGVLMQDGWSTKQNDPVISHCLFTSDQTYFLSAESTNADKKDAQFCYKLLERAKNKCEEQYSCEIVGVVTDNCSAMKAMHSLVKDNYPHIEVYGCNAHLLNLLGEKYTNRELQDKINSVQVYMKSHHYTSGKLNELGGKRPVLPGSTRWNSQIDSYLNYLENQVKYLDIVRKMTAPKSKEENEKFKKICKIVEDGSIYSGLKDEINLLKPICVALDKIQGDKCNLADSTDLWLQLEIQLPHSITGDSYFIKQKKLGVTPVAIAAHLLHPKFKGRGLFDKDKDIGLEWISQHNPLFICAVTALRQKESDYFLKSFMDDEICKSMSPLEWWNNATKSTVPTGLLKLVNKIFSLPPSTGAIERSFSTLGNIMTTQRNQLEVSTASKLCCVNNDLKLQDERVIKAKKRKFNLAE